MLKSGLSKREKVRIKFGQRMPKIKYRLTHQLQMTEVELVDLSETGFAFKINDEDQVTRVGDILFVDFSNVSHGEPETEYTARVKRFQKTKDGLIFAAEFMSVSKEFTQMISKWAKVYQKAGYFLVERRSPISIALRATQKPFYFIELIYNEIKWQWDSLQFIKGPIAETKVKIASRNLANCMDFEQI